MLEELTRIPDSMAAWNMRLRPCRAVEAGEYVLVGARPASIEQHHQVILLDEGERPLRGVWVIFGYPKSQEPVINLQAQDISNWPEAPAVLIGNAQRTDSAGYAQHTVGAGGEDIWVWDLVDGVLQLPSPIIENCTWVSTEEGGPFNHSGVELTIQRRRKGIPLKSDAERLTALENRMTEIDERLTKLELGV